MNKEAFKADDDWSYSGDTGPEHWSEIAPLCATGRQQSPIDLEEFIPGDLPPLHFHYDVRALCLANNGHAVQVHFEPGGAIEVGDHRFDLDHLHFHAPAEHRIQGKGYELEAHFVHKDEANATAVVALLYEDGAFNRAFAKIDRLLPANKGETHELAIRLTAAEFLPDKRDYYYYDGSLTTPPATEGIGWYILKTPLTIETSEVQGVLRADDGPNNRPLQARNGRKVLA
ncbi:MAG: carbonic anhydrase family protein [Gammaproteobacteria bacterium]|nr:carbonic anhydrase family protein [Gammaproteobacteria bacterium]